MRQLGPSLSGTAARQPKFAPFARCLRALCGDRRAETIWQNLIELHVQHGDWSEVEDPQRMEHAVAGSIQWLADYLVGVGACTGVLLEN